MKRSKKKGIIGIAAASGMAGAIALSLWAGKLPGNGKQNLVFAFGNSVERHIEIMTGDIKEQWEEETESEAETENPAETGDETEIERGTETETEIESGADTESETEDGEKPESETDMENGTENGTETESGAETGTETESGTETEPETESGTKTGTETESGTETGTETESGAEAGTETENGTEAETEIENGTETETEIESGTETETEIENGTETGTETESGPEAESERETVLGLITETPETVRGESGQEKIQRGRDYEIEGDSHAWYRDKNDHLWVRAGTNLYIRAKADSRYGSGPEMENLRQDGVLTFSLKKMDDQGNILAESEIKQESYFVDGEAPSADISISGEGQNGILYASQAADARIVVAPDGKSGLKSAAYSVLKCEEDGTLLQQPEETGWTECFSSQQLELQEEGCFQIFVRTEDNVGNVAFTKSNIVCVDATAPEIIVEGVGDQTANSGSVRLKITSSDAHYKQGSTQIRIEGMNQGKLPALKKQEESQQGALSEYYDFPKRQEYDDIYHVSIQTEDIAGNRAERELDFSVNRYGSVYDLSTETKQNLKQYFLAEPQDIVFYETNIDYVGESRIYCRRDGELQELSRGTDYQVNMQGSETSWKQYRYTIPADYFKKEGVYEILLSSNDRAENQSDTGMQEKQVAFVLDWTSPECMVTGVVGQQVYESSSVMACLIPSDNIGIKTMQVYHDSQKLLEEKDLQRENEPIKVLLEAAESWQTLQVYLCDMAGNEYWSEEIPVYINETVKNIPQYQKLRASAREIQQEEAGGGETVHLSGNAGSREGESEASERGVAKAAFSALSGKRKTEGIVLLAIGAVMLITTAVSCFLSGIGRKK